MLHLCLSVVRLLIRQQCQAASTVALFEVKEPPLAAQVEMRID